MSLQSHMHLLNCTLYLLVIIYPDNFQIFSMVIWQPSNYKHVIIWDLLPLLIGSEKMVLIRYVLQLSQTSSWPIFEN